MSLEELYKIRSRLMKEKDRRNIFNRYYHIVDIVTLEGLLEDLGDCDETVLSIFEEYIYIIGTSLKIHKDYNIINDILPLLFEYACIILDKMDELGIKLNITEEYDGKDIIVDNDSLVLEFLKKIDENYSILYKRELDRGNFTKIPERQIDKGFYGDIVYFYNIGKYFMEIDYHGDITDGVTKVHEFGHMIHLINLKQKGVKKLASPYFIEVYSTFIENLYCEFLCEKGYTDVKKITLLELNNLFNNAQNIYNFYNWIYTKKHKVPNLAYKLLVEKEIQKEGNSYIYGLIYEFITDLIIFYFLNMKMSLQYKSFSALGYITRCESTSLKRSLTRLNLDSCLGKVIEKSYDKYSI